MEQYFEEAMPQNELSKEDKSLMESWKTDSAADKRSDEDPDGSFNCNICLDSVQDPVVTLCGHLYCWPCIYKWLHIQGISTEEKHPQCPVCKAEVSETTLVPLYGRSEATKSSNRKGGLGTIIPRRPSGPAYGIDAPLLPSTTAGSLRASQQLYYRNYRHHPQPYHPHPQPQPQPQPHPSSYVPSPMLSTTAGSYHPLIGMFGEMVYTRVFGNSVTNMYTYPNSYHLAGSTTARMRRQEMQADKSLGRICFFLFCCTVLCLLLF